MAQVKITTQELRLSLASLAVLRNQPKPGPALGLKLARNFREIDPAIQALQEQELAILRETAELSEDGKEFLFTDEAKTSIKLKDPEAYQAKMVELMAVEQEFNLSILSEADLATATGLRTGDYALLYFMLDVPKD